MRTDMVLAASLSNLISTTNAPGAPASTRVAMLFTSTLRRRLAAAAARRELTPVSAQLAVLNQQGARARAAFVASGASAERTRENAFQRQTIQAKKERVLAYSTSAKKEYEALFSAIAQREVMPVIAMALNPNSVQFRQGKRITKKDTREGSVFFHFTNEQGRNDDVLVISARGNTGNLDRRVAAEVAEAAHAGRAPGYDPETTRRLLVWHNLYLLTHEPVVLPDGSENVITITYTSKVFPASIDLHGHFNAVLEFTEEGAKPHSLNYSFEFTVRWTDPPITETLDIISDALMALTTSDTGIASGATVAGANVGIR